MSTRRDFLFRSIAGSFAIAALARSSRAHTDATHAPEKTATPERKVEANNII
jgi:hypothetical protein